MPDMGIVQQLLSEGEIPVGIAFPILVHDASIQQHWCAVEVHEKQLVDPGGEYWPAGQKSQLVDPADEEYRPAGQEVHLPVEEE